MWHLFEWTFLTIVLIGFVFSVFRLRNTLESDPEFQPRKLMCGLLFLMAIGTGGSMARDRVPEFSTAYWILGIGLLPLAGVAIWLVKKLLDLYREENRS